MGVWPGSEVPAGASREAVKEMSASRRGQEPRRQGHLDGGDDETCQPNQDPLRVEGTLSLIAWE